LNALAQAAFVVIPSGLQPVAFFVIDHRCRTLDEAAEIDSAGTAEEAMKTEANHA
jgi:hypothetical protein